MFNDGAVILQEMETLRLHLYDNTLNEIKVIEQGEEDALLPIGFTEDKMVWVLDEENSYWIFSEITANSFKWENVMIADDGTRARDCEIYGKRVK